MALIAAAAILDRLDGRVATSWMPSRRMGAEGRLTGRRGEDWVTPALVLYDDDVVEVASRLIGHALRGVRGSAVQHCGTTGRLRA